MNHCCKIITGPRVTSWRCPKPGKYEVDGKWYCGIHDPVKAKARLDKSLAAYQEKNAAEVGRLVARNRDSARWQFFSEHAQSQWNGRKLIDWMGTDGVFKYGGRDAIIDAAMADHEAAQRPKPTWKNLSPSTTGSSPTN